MEESGEIVVTLQPIETIEVTIAPLQEIDIETISAEKAMELQILPRGNDATINGYNTVEIAAGENIKVNSQLGKITISADDCLERLEELTNSEIEDLLK